MSNHRRIVAAVAVIALGTLSLASCGEDDLGWDSEAGGLAAAVSVVDRDVDHDDTITTDDAAADDHDTTTDAHDETNDRTDADDPIAQDDEEAINQVGSGDNDATEGDDHAATDGHATDEHGGAGDDHAAETGDGAERDDAPLPEGIDIVIDVAMLDFGYGPADFEIPVGSTVRFDFVNDGVVAHEAMLGDVHFQLEQEAPGGGDHAHEHAGEAPAIFLDPGESGTLTVTFNQIGELIMGCHIEGHWDAGMLAEIAVV